MNWNWLGRAFWYFLRRYFAGQVVLQAKRQGVRAYIRALQGTRRVLLALVVAFFLFHFVVLSGVGALVTGAFLLGLDTHTTLIILCATFSFLFLVPIVILAVCFSERLWYRYSGAEKMVEDLRDAA